MPTTPVPSVGPSRNLGVLNAVGVADENLRKDNVAAIPKCRKIEQPSAGPAEIFELVSHC